MSRFKLTLLGFLGFIVILSVSRVSVAQATDSDHVRWDIININFPAPPTLQTISPGGVAFAAARNPSTLTIKLTGSGTFIGPASGGTSSGVTGGGTWKTFSGGTLTGSGTYEVTELASWHFSNFSTGSFIDLIDEARGLTASRYSESPTPMAARAFWASAATAPGHLTERWRV